MELVGSTYGKFILEGLVVVCLTGLLFFGISVAEGTSGILEMIGFYLPKVEEEYGAYTDFNGVYLEESRKRAPEILYVAGAIDAGVISLSEIIKATDYDGRELAIEILSIRNMEDVEMITEYNFGTTEIMFERAGIYRIEVMAVDDGNRRTQCWIKIPVNYRPAMEELY